MGRQFLALFEGYITFVSKLPRREIRVCQTRKSRGSEGAPERGGNLRRRRSALEHRDVRSIFVKADSPDFFLSRGKTPDLNEI